MSAALESEVQFILRNCILCISTELLIFSNLFFAVLLVLVFISIVDSNSGNKMDKILKNIDQINKTLDSGMDDITGQ